MCRRALESNGEMRTSRCPDHPKWKPPKLVDEAKKQKWDPSVQGLVAFPQVLAMMTEDIAWTTQLGNAFLAQQPEAMQAVQRMRTQAQADGKLRSTPQEQVNKHQHDHPPGHRRPEPLVVPGGRRPPRQGATDRAGAPAVGSVA